jgi:HJR/Mrr/RecB family endonuclease
MKRFVMARRKRRRYSRKNFGTLFGILLLMGVAYEYIKKYPFIIGIAITVAVITLLLIRLNKRSLAKRYSTIEELIREYEKNPTDFEHYIANLYSFLGFKTKVTPAVNDKGKDIEMWKDNLKYVVEVKLYSPQNKIGREKIQKLHSAMIDSDADKAIFVTTSDFAFTAIEYAEKHGIELVNSRKLVSLISTVKKKM